MKTLLALITCHTRTAYAKAQRETWIPKIPEGLDYHFFLGPSERTPGPDEVFLDCNDSYWGLPTKVQAVCRWASEKGYDHLAKCDDDVSLKPTEFLGSGFQNHDFAGHTNNDGEAVQIPWGFLYTLSRKSMEIMANAQLPQDHNDERWVAHTLAQHGILLHHESRYILHYGKRSDFFVPRKRPLRAPPRPILMEEGTRRDAIATCIFLQHFGYHQTPDELNIKELHKVFKETQ